MTEPREASPRHTAAKSLPPRQATDDRVCSCTFETGRWRHGDDPQPGATGTGGSPWPLLGDRLAKEYDVPGVFAGPVTDAYQARGWLADAVHLNERGLAAHAEGWAETLEPLIAPAGRRR